MNLEIAGKVAVVTGGGRGIGRAIALTLAGEGVHVCIADMNEDTGEKTAAEIRELGVKSIFVKVDVSKQDEVVNLFKTTAETMGSVDILINDAGISPQKDVPFYELSAEDFQKVLGVNLTSMYLCASAAYPYMKEKHWGRIINMASMAGLYGGDAAALHYASSKGGVISLTMGLAKKMGKDNITVNSVAPGRITTEMTKALSEEANRHFWERTALARNGSAQEVADVITFLASERASFISGVCLPITGFALY